MAEERTDGQDREAGDGEQDRGEAEGRRDRGDERDGESGAEERAAAPAGEERDLIGEKVVDPHGDKVGKIDAIFAHSDDDRASWALVKMDPIGVHSAFIPLHDAQDEGGDVRIVYEKEHVKAAPEIEPEGNELSDEQADQLHRHYGMDRVTGLTAPGEDDDIELPRETRDAKPPAMGEGPLPKPPIPDMPEEDQPSPVKKEEPSGESGESSGKGESGESAEGQSEDSSGEGDVASGESAEEPQSA